MTGVNTTEEKGVGFKIWGADDVVYGPVELPVLVDWIKEERVVGDTWIYSEAADTWNKASQLNEVSMFFRGGAAPGAPRPAGEAAPLVQGIKPGMLRRVKILAEMNDQQLGRFVQPHGDVGGADDPGQTLDDRGKLHQAHSTRAARRTAPPVSHSRTVPGAAPVALAMSRSER